MNLTQANALVAPHVNAVLARLKATSSLLGAVFEGEAKGDPERYLNVFHDTGLRSAHDFLDNQVDIEITFTLHGVGSTREQAVWVTDRATEALFSFTPTVAGRRCWRMRSIGSQPVRRDDDVSPPKFLTVDRWSLRSTPAKE